MTTKKKGKYSSGGNVKPQVGSIRSDPRPMTLPDRMREARARTAVAIGDSPEPERAKTPAKPKPYFAGGPVTGTGMERNGMIPNQTPMGRFGSQGMLERPNPGVQPFNRTPMDIPPVSGNPMDGRPLRGGRAFLESGGPAFGPGYKKGGKIDGCATRGMTKGGKK